MASLLPLALFFFGACAQEAKNAVPSEDAQGQAEKTVRATYKSEYADPSGQQGLAKKLADHAAETKEDVALRFVLLREAGDVASRAGDLDTLLRSIDELYGGFHLVGIEFKAPQLLRMEPLLAKPEDLKKLGSVLLRLVKEALELDQFDVAAKAAQSAAASYRKSKDATLTARAESAGKSVSEAKVAFEKARKAEELLAAAPDDAAANQVWGEWLCFQKGRWDRGLAYLLKAPVSPLRAMALREYAGSAELASLVDVADGWWDLAAVEKQPQRKSQLIAHARSIYTAALPKSNGDLRAKIGKRLEFDPDAPIKK